MKVDRLPARTGWRWVIGGFLLLRRQPVPLLALTFLNLVLLSVSSVVPLVGPLLPMVLSPVFMVGLMHGVRCADQGGMPTPWMLFEGFRVADGSRWKPLLVLGVLNAAATLGALALAALADGGTLLQLATGSATPESSVPVDHSLITAVFVFLLTYTPVQIAFWYAPLFVAWHGIGVTKALFFSFFAVLRNTRAFIVYAAGWFALVLSVSLAVQALLVALEGSALLLSWILSPLSLLVLAGLYCSFWPTYRDAIDFAEPEQEITET